MQYVPGFLVLHPDVKVSDHTQRLGCEAAGGYQKLKEHPFFSGIDWDGLPEQEPPKILPYLPSNTKDGEALKSDYDVSTTDLPLEGIEGMAFKMGTLSHSIYLTLSGISVYMHATPSIVSRWLGQSAMMTLMSVSCWHGVWETQPVHRAPTAMWQERGGRSCLLSRPGSHPGELCAHKVVPLCHQYSTVV